MTNFDLSPLYRSTVGFDHLFDMLDQASRVQPATGRPTTSSGSARTNIGSLWRWRALSPMRLS